MCFEGAPFDKRTEANGKKGTHYEDIVSALHVSQLSFLRFGLRWSMVSSQLPLLVKRARTPETLPQGSDPKNLFTNLAATVMKSAGLPTRDAQRGLI